MMSTQQHNVLKVYSTNNAKTTASASGSVLTTETSSTTTEPSTPTTNTVSNNASSTTRVLVPAFLIPNPDGTSALAHIVPSTQAGPSQTLQNLIINSTAPRSNLQSPNTVFGMLTPVLSGGQGTVKVVTPSSTGGAKISITPGATPTPKATTLATANRTFPVAKVSGSEVKVLQPAQFGHHQLLNQLNLFSTAQLSKKTQPEEMDSQNPTSGEGQTQKLEGSNIAYKKLADGSYVPILNEFPNLITIHGLTSEKPNSPDDSSITVASKNPEEDVEDDSTKDIVLETDEKMDDMCDIDDSVSTSAIGAMSKDDAESGNESIEAAENAEQKNDEDASNKPTPMRQFKRPSILGAKKKDKPSQAMLKEKLKEELRRMDAQEKSVESNKKKKPKFFRDKKTGAKIAPKIDQSLIRPAIEDFDPANLLEWRDGVGVLPGSNLKFRVNELGLMELVEESEGSDMELDTDDLLRKCENIPIIQKTKSDVDDAVPKKRARKEKVSSYSTCCCEQCGCYGLASEYIKQRFCSTTCSDKFEKRKAAAQKKKEQEEMDRKEKSKAEAAEVELKKIDASKWTLSATGSEEGTSETLPCPESPDPEVPSSAAESVPGDSKPNTEPNSPAPSSSATPVSDQDEDSRNPEGYPNDMPWINFNTDRTPNFLWPKYLEFTKTRAAPAKLFEEGGFPDRANGFRPGMKLEGIDPRMPAQFVVLTVVSTKGFRVKMHIDGASDSTDFWVNADSKDIFPAGHCEKISRKLSPPKAVSKKFNWAHYVKATNATLAPRNLFVHRQTSKNTIGPSGFRIGMKLEALDKSNHELVCVATVRDILGGRILIHFDSWDDTYDYWVDPSSTFIHPIGWCESVGIELVPPKGYREFNWDDYLRETKSQAVPHRAFKPKPSLGFKRGMKLECVDPRFPQLIRVGSILEVRNSRLHIGFDNWPLETSTWMDSDSPDIHPMGWCNKTGHPLGPPPVPGVEYQCYTQGCRALLKNSQFVLPHMGSCPLSTSNLAKARFCRYSETKLKQVEKVEMKLEEEEVPEEEEQDTTLGIPEDTQTEVPVGRNKKKRGIEPAQPPSNPQSVRSDVHESVFRPGYAPSVKNMPVAKATHAKLVNWSKIEGKFDLSIDGVKKWTPEEVCSFADQVLGAADKPKKFVEENISGDAFLMLSQSDLVELLGFKIGQAVKIFNSILLLKEDY
ncbi:Hypothetical predicted protein [Cloeon dipterum]|uniref:SAM domain-containing protein n=1 Tax=Cloeon dipterum TaxID=197152 RepID=A0A8S1DLZ6_9INSE|nr:Hypothetical predicted protein [Cloeon dipterum]